MEQIKDLVSLNRQTQVNRIATCSSKAYALIARSLLHLRRRRLDVFSFVKNHHIYV
jgi:hypothetical protein